MRAYDLALVVIRVSAALQLVQSAVTGIFCCVRIGLTWAAASSLAVRHFAMISELSQFTFPMEEAAAAAVFLVFSKPLARFAAKAAAGLAST